MEMDKDIEKYYSDLNGYVDMVYKIADNARKKGFDPVRDVEIPLARNMAERVEGLISAVAPQIKGSGIVERIGTIEKKYGKLDWRVALVVGLEIAQEKFCKFVDKREAMEVGIRIGLAYLSNGVVASPLEGFTNLRLQKRKDGKEYFDLMFSGPIRSAGTTVTCGAILVADYIRKKMGYSKYDATEEEVKRMVTELIDYHEKVTNLQYFPSEKEVIFMVENLPVQIDGDPSEKYEVSNYKDLARIETNRIRNGPCLVLGEALCQKAAKFWGKLSKFKEEFEINDWDYIKDFVKLQKSVRSGKQEESEDKLKPDFNYIKDLVAGRPILTHPLRTGGFRLRYGRVRMSGLSSMAMHPATMELLDDFIGIGTQLRYERPGKSSAMSLCDGMEGPIVKLKDGGVVLLENRKQAKGYFPEVEEILFLGDLLMNYGEFFNRAHMLCPVGYCEEYWLREVEEKLDSKKPRGFHKKFGKLFSQLQKDFLTPVNFKAARDISEFLDVPLHARWTYHWKDISIEEFTSLIKWINKGDILEDKIVLPLITNIGPDPKRVLELLGVPHRVIAKEHVVIEGDDAVALLYSLGDFKSNNVGDVVAGCNDGLDVANKLCNVILRDKSGTFIGARMGRPEKAKMRKLTGSPHVLFPVGEEGGKLRSFNAAIEKGKINAQFPIFVCPKCNKESIYPYCGHCNMATNKRYYCRECLTILNNEKCEKHGSCMSYKTQTLPVKEHFHTAMNILGVKEYPEMIKGVRGTSNADHTPENLVKGILRSTHDVYVNKDGTTRFDVTEMPLTSFKPIEIGTPVSRLRELGYERDVDGEKLVKDDQLVELKPSDIVLPACKGSSFEGADQIFLRLGGFVDDLLANFYGLEPFYKFKKKEDILGHLVAGLAPHTSAAIVGRVIGFTETQGCFAHPLWHSAMRRDCFSGDTKMPLQIDGEWQNVCLGDYVEKLQPHQVVDAFGTLVVDVSNVSTLAYDGKTGKLDVMPVKWFTKHEKQKLIKLTLENGREIKTTRDHKFYVENKGIHIKKVYDIEEGDHFLVPYVVEIPSKNISFIHLEELYSKRKDVMIKGIKKYVEGKLTSLGLDVFLKRFELNRYDIYNYLSRDCFPMVFVMQLLHYFSDDFGDLPRNRILSIKRNFVQFPYKIPVNRDVLEIVGFYLAEGYARKKLGKKGYYQVDFAIYEDDLRQRIKKKIYKYFKLLPSKTKERRLTYNSKLFYEFFVDILRCGKGAHTKRIPSKFLNLPLHKLSGLLRAYFEGEGSVSKGDLRVSCDTVSTDLVSDLELVLSRYAIYVRKYTTTRKPGAFIQKFYAKKNRKIPLLTSTKLIISGKFVHKYFRSIDFISERKKNILRQMIRDISPKGLRVSHDDAYAYLSVIKKEILSEETTYCLNVPGHHSVIANGIIARQCEGDETTIMLLMDMLINFSRKYLPAHRGATQDAPLVLTSTLIPSEVDDMVFDMDVVEKYPLELYRAGRDYKMPWDIKIEQLNDRLGSEKQYAGFKATHKISNINNGVLCSAYKSIPSMMGKVLGQVGIAERIRAVDQVDVARLVIERHFIRDIRGNLRKFSQQEFRCTNCNEKYRRPPLFGNCLRCGGNIIFTVSEGNIVKYLEPSMSLAQKYDLPNYLQQSLELTKARIESVFGRDKDRQEGLGKWFG